MGKIRAGRNGTFLLYLGEHLFLTIYSKDSFEIFQAVKGP